MTTSPTSAAPPTTAPTGDRPPLRLELHAGAKGSTDGTWWPRSRDLPTEAADLLDHFPESAGRINRLLFSRPDWDNATEDGHSLHRVIARRGPVKIGSFPSDDTHLMILSMASDSGCGSTSCPATSTRPRGSAGCVPPRRAPTWADPPRLIP